MTEKRKSNPEFTTDEARTAQNITDEGSFACWRRKGYAYPEISVRMCDRETLEPTSGVFGTKITTTRSKYFECPPELFPPDGKGRWKAHATGRRAERIIERLKPLLTANTIKKWEENLKKCEPRPPYIRYKRFYKKRGW